MQPIFSIFVYTENLLGVWGIIYINSSTTMYLVWRRRTSSSHAQEAAQTDHPKWHHKQNRHGHQVGAIFPGVVCVRHHSKKMLMKYLRIHMI